MTSRGDVAGGRRYQSSVRPKWRGRRGLALNALLWDSTAIGWKNIRVGEARIFRLFTTGSEVCCGAGRSSRRRHIRVGHGLDPSMDWVGLDWIGSDDCNPLFFFIYIFSILTTDKRWRCNAIMCILADFNRSWLDCEFYKTSRLGSIALWHPLI